MSAVYMCRNLPFVSMALEAWDNYTDKRPEGITDVANKILKDMDCEPPTDLFDVDRMSSLMIRLNEKPSKKEAKLFLGLSTLLAVSAVALLIFGSFGGAAALGAGAVYFGCGYRNASKVESYSEDLQDSFMEEIVVQAPVIVQIWMNKLESKLGTEDLTSDQREAILKAQTYGEWRLRRADNIGSRAGRELVCITQKMSATVLGKVQKEKNLPNA